MPNRVAGVSRQLAREKKGMRKVTTNLEHGWVSLVECPDRLSDEMRRVFECEREL